MSETGAACNMGNAQNRMGYTAEASDRWKPCTPAYPPHLLDLVVVALVPEPVGGAHETVVVPAVHAVTGMHQHAKQLVLLRLAAAIAHVRRQVQPRVKVHLAHAHTHLHHRHVQL